MHNGHGHRRDAGGCAIVPLVAWERECGARSDAAGLADLDAIFFASSTTRAFADVRQRDAFRERWLGRYLRLYRQHFFIALGPEARIVGYLAGCLDDPARQSLFDDIGYFPALADLTRLYPAHLHVNLDARWRSRGIGARLIATFCDHAAAAGSPGVHVVTGAASRNVPFYRRCGFVPLREMDWSGARIAVLGRPLAAPAE